MGDPKPSGDKLGPILREIRLLWKAVRDLKTPSGTQKVAGVDQILATVNYLASLKTEGSTGVSQALPTIPNDGVIHWYTLGTPLELVMDVPTGQCIVTASCGEASMTPGSSFVTGYVSYRIRDVNGTNIPGAALGANRGRVYTNSRMGVTISTGPCTHSWDPVAYPGPYEIELLIGEMAATLNAAPVTGATFNDPALVVQVIGDGV